tara:strand:- start:1269 stop:1511 length:243 start_codon:yes stop_codon:yes gene_type:complete
MKHKKVRAKLIEFGEENNMFCTTDASIYLRKQRTLRGTKIKGFDLSSQVLGNLLSSHISFEKIERRKRETVWKFRGNKNE